MTSKPLVFFPGCALEGTGREYGESTLTVLETLGRPVSVLEDWSCCGATAARGTDVELSVRLCARNLDLAARQGADMLVICAACYNNLAFSRQYLEKHPDVWAAAEKKGTGDSLGRPEKEPVHARPESVSVHHLLNVLTTEEMLDHIKHRIVRPLGDMRLACYYGCLLVRPDTYVNVDDPENPQVMEKLMGLCGARTIEWSYKTDCCGGSFTLTNRETALQLLAKIFQSALDQDVTALVTACPLCQMNLDAWQGAVGEVLGRKLSIPIYYFTELLGLAMGLPDAKKWLRRHLTDARLALTE